MNNQAPEPVPVTDFASGIRKGFLGRLFASCPTILLSLAFRVDEEGVNRNVSAGAPRSGRTVSGRTKPPGNRWDKNACGQQRVII
jgi:hypothetical protein